MMTSLQVICGLGPPNQKSWLRLCVLKYCSGVNLDCVRNTFEALQILTYAKLNLIYNTIACERNERMVIFTAFCYKKFNALAAFS